jgi:hypothetical protein
LAKQQLIERHRDPQDRRSVIVTVTPRGEDLLRHAPSLLQERFRAELSRVQDWERTLVLSTLQRIAAMMDVESLDASPMLIAGTHVSEGERAPAADSGSHAADPPTSGVTAQRVASVD